ncbi:MAG: hypothetical protein ACOYVK_03865 [Bacillota bacterium]
MIIQWLIEVTIMLLLLSVLGFILSVLKEKYYLSNKQVVIEHKSVTQDDIDNIEATIFRIGNTNIKAGDEMKIELHNKLTIKGLVLGANIEENSIVLITKGDKVETIKIQGIKYFRIISKYGKFF